MARNVAERFWEKVDVRGHDECWPWTAYIGSRGYGGFMFETQNTRAHRVAWMLDNNQAVPKDLCVLHSCHNKSCVNPAHLRVGTKKDNADDMMRAGRRGGPVGEDQPTSKLVSDQVRRVRALYETGAYRQVDLAQMVGVSQGHLSRILRRASWRAVS